MNPIIFLAAGAAALLLSGGKKKSKSKSKTEPSPSLGSGTGSPSPKPGPAHSGGLSIKSKYLDVKGKPWDFCRLPSGTPKGTYAAIGEDGVSCLIFWKPETDGIAREYIKAELESLNDSQKAMLCSVKGSPMSPGYGYSDTLTGVAWKVIAKMYPQIRADALNDPDAPYMVKFIRDRVLWILGHDECHFNKVT